jgi:hypothetical protein|uniref:Succinyl-CoA synthetase subunit alpha n=1 Tax=candidate division WOR-3 bacterium TaxID=2052148 RepID=A0A7C6A9V4_UNCW3
MKNDNSTSLNYEWYITADTKKYAGKWIAIVKQKIVVSGDQADEVYKKAKKKYPGEKPSLAKVPDKEILVLGYGR